MFKNKKIIALCTSRIFDPLVHVYIESLNNLIKNGDYKFVVYSINTDIYWNENNISAETGIFDAIPFKYVDFLLIMDEKIKSHTVSRKIINSARKYQIPTIILDGKYDGTIEIKFDYAGGFEKAVRHIIEDHHVKNPVMIAGIPGNPFSEERIEVFKKVLEENNIPYSKDRIAYGNFWSAPSRVAIQSILDRGIVPDAVICASDIMAINVCDVLINNGYKVPEDILVSGFDGSDEAFFTTPRVATAGCDYKDLANATFDCIKKLENGEDVPDMSILPKLIVNESCGCPKHDSPSNNMLEIFNNHLYRHQDDLRTLYNMSASMFNCESSNDMMKALSKFMPSNYLCAVTCRCLETDENYFLSEENKPWTDELYLFYNSKNSEEDIKYSYDSYDLFYKILAFGDNGYPLFFNAVEYMNKTIGFICYSFSDYNLINYARTAGFSNAIGIGIGGYINMANQRALHEQIAEMYRHDALTGLYNRVAFQNVFRQVKFDPANYGKSITVIMSDLDGLKYINDHYGHADGDSAISQLSQALINSVPAGAISTRFGGDEVFSVIIGECDPEQIIRDMDDYLDDYNRSSGLTYYVTTSTGAYTTTLTEEYDILQAIKMADEKLYEIKNAKNLKRGQAPSF